MASKDRILSREVIATQIPSGDKTTLHADTKVMIHQTLGGSYTVQTDFGLFRIDGKDGDALGETVTAAQVAASTLADGAPDPAAIWSQLRQVFDPEIPVNIVDLGLIYGLEVNDGGDEGKRVKVTMTLTAPGCGMGQVLKDDVESKVRGLPGVVDAEVELTFEPPWGPDRMTEEAQLELGFY